MSGFVVGRWFREHSLWNHLAAPVWVRLPEKHRWRIVNWLNRSERRCWSTLVDDAVGWHDDERDACDVYVPQLRDTSAITCGSVCNWSHSDHTGEHECACYCGKARFLAPDGALDRSGASA